MKETHLVCTRDKVELQIFAEIDHHVTAELIRDSSTAEYVS